MRFDASVVSAGNKKTPATAATVRGHDRPGRGDMAKRTQRFPEDTPVSRRRLNPQPQPPRRGIPKPSIQCVWPDCRDLQQFAHGVPLCFDHIDQVYKFASDLRWGETFEETITRSRRQRAAEWRRGITAARENKIYETKGDKPGWIYYLHIDDKVKIGYTTDIIRRMRSYPPSSPLLGVHPGTKQLERDMHEQFKGSLIQGREWFRPDPDLLAHCERVRAEYGDPSKFEYKARDPYETKQITAVKGWSGKRPA